MKNACQLLAQVINQPIIDGKTCQSDFSKCFDKINERYVKVKSDVAIRVYKKTRCHDKDVCLTSLILLPNTKVHLGKFYWDHKIIIPKLKHLGCRSDSAYVEKSIDTETGLEHQKVISGWLYTYAYLSGTTVQIDDFYGEKCYHDPLLSECSGRKDGYFFNTSRQRGIHFFMNCTDALRYQHH